MSKLRVTMLGGTYLMNVLSFQSGVYQTVASAQTKSMAVHFPIKVNQPDIDFSVIFSNENDYQNFQEAVRRHQQIALQTSRVLTLNWPERNIVNWTGVIKSFKAGGARYNYAPRANFTVQLIDSLASDRVELASWATPWQNIYGANGAVDAVLRLPSAALDQFLLGAIGTTNPLENGVASVPYWWPL